MVKSQTLPFFSAWDVNHHFVQCIHTVYIAGPLVISYQTECDGVIVLVFK
jgi:hypothetical protein